MKAVFRPVLLLLGNGVAGDGAPISRSLRLAAGRAIMPLAALLLLLAGPWAAALAGEAASARQVIHVLDRLAFGPSAEDVRHVSEIGIERYIAEQLDPAAIAEPAVLTERLAALETLRLTPLELMERYGHLRPVGGVPPTFEQRQARRLEARIVMAQATHARIVRALHSRRQLNEVMVDFWFNHFNVFGPKPIYGILVGAYEEQAIRPHALGKFGDLLLATARHPAMLLYLDNFQNSAPGTKLRDGREIGLNENYAREVMELHTLGVDGGYTQEDIIALARILTGWTFVGQERFARDGSAFRFLQQRHDFGPKRLLGRDIAPTGEAEGIEALDMLARHPSTARHIAFKLAQYFVADTPPPALVDRLAERFRDSEGDIRAVLHALFASPEFRDSIASKYKSPYRYILSAVRAAGVAVSNPRPLLHHMTRLGMPLYHCPTPDGYPDTADKWLSPDAGPKRVSFALALARGAMPLVGADPATTPDMAEPADPARSRNAPVDAAAVQALLDPILSDQTRAAIAAAPAGQRAALLLGSPDFMRR
jgi:uncharacterized protein (DUF1800 family)